MMTTNRSIAIGVCWMAAVHLCCFCWVTAEPTTQPSTVSRSIVSVDADARGTKISTDLFGVFFEDINYSADGGLYGELVENRSFEYSADDHGGWHPLAFWHLVERDGGKGELSVDTADPLNARNPHYAVLKVSQAGGVGLANNGFGGIVVDESADYDFSCFARRLEGEAAPLIVRLESGNGRVYAQCNIDPPTGEWRKYSAVLKSTSKDPNARLVVLSETRGAVALDMISLFPRKTFRDRPNGLRADLAQSIADIGAKFVRFPGGCLVHGDGLENIYHWKDTVGPVETRKEQRNIWGYHQSVGLGYFEYFQFCEDIGAKALPVVAAGVSCQNSHRRWGVGQEPIPMDRMDEYVQDVLDLVEFANGPATSTWGAKRAAAGHPKPFNLEYLGVGNEDHITPEFRQRFEMIHKALQKKYPKLTVIGTVGPAAGGWDYDQGWKFAGELKLPMVDEHYYMPPGWFLGNLRRYDSYDRSRSKVYIGEYASHGNALSNALAEAAYMTAMERNGDVVHMASYAPLLARIQNIQWRPDLIYFSNTAILRSANYYVQQMFATHSGDTYLPTAVTPPAQTTEPVGIFLGTWDTQAEFDNVQLTSGGKTLIDEPFEKPADGWRGESGEWTVLNGVLRQSAGGAPLIARATQARVFPDRDGLNYTLALRARKVGGAEGFLIGFGATEDGDDYWLNLGGWGNMEHGIEKRHFENRQFVGQRVRGEIQQNRWYDVKVVVAGRKIKCFLDNRLILDVVDKPQPSEAKLFASTVRDTRSGDLILKLVNVASVDMTTQIKLDGLGANARPARCTVLTGERSAHNTFEKPDQIVPKSSDLSASGVFDYVAPANSLSVIRVKTR